MTTEAKSNQLTGDDIILLNPGDEVIVHGLTSCGWVEVKSKMNINREIECHHGWLNDEFYLKNHASYKVFRA